jgi:hypothetical protein
MLTIVYDLRPEHGDDDNGVMLFRVSSGRLLLALMRARAWQGRPGAVRSAWFDLPGEQTGKE